MANCREVYWVEDISQTSRDNTHLDNINIT